MNFFLILMMIVIVLILVGINALYVTGEFSRVLRRQEGEKLPGRKL